MVTDRIIRWGVSATGRIAECFARDVALVPGASLHGVTSRNPENAEAFARSHPGAVAFPSLEEMVASPQIDAIYIASPHTAHLRQAQFALAASKPLLIEKPLTADLQEANALAEAVGKANVFAMEAMWSRFLPAVRMAREKIGSGTLGTIRKLEAELAWFHPYEPANRLFNPATGGGSLLDLGVYPLSLARFLLGEPDRMGGNWTAAPNGVDIRADLELGFGDTIAIMSCGFDRNGDNRLIVEGDKATLVLGLPFIGANRLGIYKSRDLADLVFPGTDTPGARLRRKLLPLLPIPGVRHWDFPFAGKGLQFEIEIASNAIRNGRLEEPDCTLSDSIATLKIIDQILANAPTDHWQPG